MRKSTTEPFDPNKVYPSIWGNDNEVATLYNRYATLVPSFGPANTLQGELLRAAASIVYSGYNDGFGRDLSGQVEFLNKHIDLGLAYRVLSLIVHERSPEDPAPYQNAANFILAEVLVFIKSGPAPVENREDMLDYAYPRPEDSAPGEIDDSFSLGG